MIKHLYVHVPFCKSICYYCDFCHNVYNTDLVNKWLKALKNEIDNVCHDEYETIYIGGGTPNSLSYDELDLLLSYLKPFSHKAIEYTIELNPECFDDKQIELFKKYNINRFSIGVQSTNNTILKSINRKHTYNDIKYVVNTLKSNGFNNISCDLMYSLPNQSLDDIKKSIDDLINLNIPHISIYSLTIEENSVFGKNNVNHLDDDSEADMYEFIVKYLKENNYIQYEVSNFAKDGYMSKHNSAYWDYDDYLGISLGSSSKIGNHRYTTTRSFSKYFESYLNRDEDLLLNKKDLIIENIMMSLRTNKGLYIKNFNDKYNVDFFQLFNEALKKFKNELYIENGYIKVINLAILNYILTYFYIDLENKF